MWLFKRKPKHIGPKTVDWQPGDMAECVDQLWTIGPKVGDQMLVTGVRYGTSISGRYKMFALKLLGADNKTGYNSSAFKKIILTDTGADRKVSKRKPVTVQS